MKRNRLFIFVTILLVFLNNIAFAEEFELRNGIHFGDSLDTIVKKETTLTRSDDTSSSFVGRIAGFDDSTCDFDVGENDKLISMNYKFDCYSKDDTTNKYKTLYDSLVRKYGNPEGNTGGNCDLITGPAISSMALWVYLFGELDGWSADYYDYDEWIVDLADYHVKIDLVSYYYRNSDFEYTYSINLSYLKFTDEDYQKEIDKKTNEQKEVDNDL